MPNILWHRISVTTVIDPTKKASFCLECHSFFTQRATNVLRAFSVANARFGLRRAKRGAKFRKWPRLLFVCKTADVHREIPKYASIAARMIWSLTSKSTTASTVGLATEDTVTQKKILLASWTVTAYYAVLSLCYMNAHGTRAMGLLDTHRKLGYMEPWLNPLLLFCTGIYWASWSEGFISVWTVSIAWTSSPCS